MVKTSIISINDWHRECQGSADHIAWKYPSGCFGCCCSDHKEEGGHDIFFTIMGSLIKDVMNIKMATIELGSRDGRGSFLFHRLGLGREGQGQKSRGRGGKGKGPKSVGRGTYCVYQLIEIICYSKGNLNLHCIM